VEFIFSFTYVVGLLFQFQSIALKCKKCKVHVISSAELKMFLVL